VALVDVDIEGIGGQGYLDGSLPTHRDCLDGEIIGVVPGVPSEWVVRDRGGDLGEVPPQFTNMLPNIVKPRNKPPPGRHRVNLFPSARYEASCNGRGSGDREC
jgi:hypothetical protein